VNNCNIETIENCEKILTNVPASLRVNWERKNLKEGETLESLKNKSNGYVNSMRTLLRIFLSMSIPLVVVAVVSQVYGKQFIAAHEHAKVIIPVLSLVGILCFSVRYWVLNEQASKARSRYEFNLRLFLDTVQVLVPRGILPQGFMLTSEAIREYAVTSAARILGRQHKFWKDRENKHIDHKTLIAEGYDMIFEEDMFDTFWKKIGECGAIEPYDKTRIFDMAKRLIEISAI